MVFHTKLASGGWQTLSLVEQLGNIGSEVGRALSAQKSTSKSRQNLALERALELFDLTIADNRWRQRLKEIVRAREVVCDYFYGSNQYGSTPKNLEAYFMQFALAARSDR